LPLFNLPKRKALKLSKILFFCNNIWSKNFN
jgi:hypothetical protein